MGFFKNVLCSDGPSYAQEYMDNVGGFVWNTQHLDLLRAEITHEEIKKAMFSIDDYKAPGPDGFSSPFFKAAWNIIGSDVNDVVISFFNSGRLLREINCTVIALVPKVPNPESMNDYKPISCCNTVYKCISRLSLRGLNNASLRL